MADVNVAHCRWTSCVVRLTKLYHKLLQTQNNFRRSIVTRRHDCTVMFMIKCCRTEVNQSNVRRLHSPEIHLLTTKPPHQQWTKCNPRPVMSCFHLKHNTLLTTGLCDRGPIHTDLILETWKQTLTNYLSHTEKSLTWKLILSHSWHLRKLWRYIVITKITTTTVLLCSGLPGWAGTRRNTHPPTILIVIQSLSASSIYHDP